MDGPLSKTKCERFKVCGNKIPLERVYNAKSRGREAKYCSPECQHIAGVVRWRQKRRAKRKPLAKQKKGAA